MQTTTETQRLADAQQRLGSATDAVLRLSGARRFASAQGDMQWLREVRQAFPAALAEQRAASAALAAELQRTGGPTDG